MSGDGEHNRSSSPLKRRASSMDPEVGGSAADQPAPEYARAMSVDVPEPGPGYAQNPDGIPPLAEQLKTIKTLQSAFSDTPVKENDVAFVVSRVWVSKALALGGDPQFAKIDVSDGVLGPIDNSDIIEEVLMQPSGDPFVRLKPGTGLEAYELFSEDAWNLIQKWHGLKNGQYPIRRVAHNTQPDASSPENIIYEMHPPVFTIHRLWSLNSGIEIPEKLKTDGTPPLVFACSASYPFNQFLKDIKDALQIPHERKVRLFEVDRTIPEADTAMAGPVSTISPPTPPSESDNPQDSWHTLLLAVPLWNNIDRSKRVPIVANDQTGNPKYNGRATLNVHNLVTDKTIVVEESTDEGSGWVATTSLSSKTNTRLVGNRPTNLSTQSRTSSGRNSPASVGPVTRGRTQKKNSWRGTGAVGLQNIGNTCYMNSALQCVRSVEELTKYFLTDEYAEEINTDNPLAYDGKMAMAYGQLLKDMYNTSNGAVRPASFKGVAGQCRATFASWGQQDSQEFLGFLLDALQEDLSRVKRKPYIEKPDSTDEMIGDSVAIAKMAEEVWEITKRRDDSVIADLFTGLYKSTLKCPTCHKISITFDPFNNLTLPLPVENLWSRAVRFYPLNDAPVLIEVDIPRHSAIETLKQFLSERTGVPVDRLMGAEEFKGKFFKIYDDSMDVSEEIRDNDIASFYEVERPYTNWPLRHVTGKRSRKSKGASPDSDDESWDDPRCDQMIVTVLHRRPSSPRYSRGGYGSDDPPAAPPHFIVLSREEARNEEAIRRKILEKVATFSTWSVLTEDTGAEGDETPDNTDAEMALTSDADSGDSKIIAKSVEGEEDIVDVTMKDMPGATPAPKAQSSVTPLKQFHDQRPRWIDPGEFLDPRLQNLFELCYFGHGNQQSPATGWQAVQDSAEYPKLSSRASEPDTPLDSTPEWTNGNGFDNESETDDGTNKASPMTRTTEESSDDEVTISIKPNMNRFERAPVRARAGANRGRPNNKKTYSRKEQRRAAKGKRGNKHMMNSQHVRDVPPQPIMPSLSEEGALIQLGEGILVEWNEQAWDQVFGQDPNEYNDPRGARTFIQLEQLKDAGLEAKRKARVARRTSGITLDDCLEEFERVEVLSENDMWYCPRCKEHRRASKKVDLWKTPDILVCHLKRFSSSGYRRDKIDIKVSFPVEGLDLEPRVLHKEDGKVEVYDLIGVDEHYGGLGGGHYTASAKNFMDGQWYHYNDSSVSKVKDPAQVVTNAAYFLFYRRRSSVPLGGPRFAEIVDRFNSRLQNDDNADGTESGDDQEVGGSSLYGSSTAGKTSGAGALRRRGLGAGASGAGSATNGNGDDLDDPPSYNVSVRRSIEHEDEGIEIGESSNTAAAGAYSTEWNFQRLGDSEDADADDDTGKQTRGKTQLVDYASDTEAQRGTPSEGADDTLMDSEEYQLPAATGSVVFDDEQPPAYEYPDEPRFAPRDDDEADVSWSDVRKSSEWRARDDDSNPVAEIRLEDDN